MFIAILSANLLLAASMFVVSSWSFQNGFLEYVNQSELNQLEGLAQALSKGYRTKQNWQWLVQDKAHWRKLVQSNTFERNTGNNYNVLRNNEPLRTGPPSPPEPKKQLVLLSAEKQVLVGSSHSHSNLILKPIFADNKTIGYLGIERRHQLSQHLDKVFADQQRSAYSWIALGSILISVIIAIPFASYLSKPVLSLLAGTKSLSQGNYGSRVQKISNDEIGKLAVAFNEMASNIEKGSLIQQQWVGDISHELRTPLAILKGEVEAIQDGIRTASPENLSSLHQEILHLSRLVDDLHELSQSDMRTLKYEKSNLSLNHLLKEISNTFQMELDEKDISLSIQNLSLNTTDTAIILADRDRLIQLFSNLMQNNLRYAGRSSQLTIRISENKWGDLSASEQNLYRDVTNSHNEMEPPLPQETAQQKLISVFWEDNGPGVKPENLAKLFDRLYREDPARTKSYKGSGLGLSICKSIVEAHNGKISAYKTSTGGLGINITFPAAN